MILQIFIVTFINYYIAFIFKITKNFIFLKLRVKLNWNIKQHLFKSLHHCWLIVCEQLFLIIVFCDNVLIFFFWHVFIIEFFFSQVFFYVDKILIKIIIKRFCFNVIRDLFNWFNFFRRVINPQIFHLFFIIINAIIINISNVNIFFFLFVLQLLNYLFNYGTFVLLQLLMIKLKLVH